LPFWPQWRWGRSACRVEQGTTLVTHATRTGCHRSTQ
jgi:hypothetical protein